MRNVAVIILGLASFSAQELLVPAQARAQGSYGQGSAGAFGQAPSKSFSTSVREGVDKFTTAITPTTPVRPADDPVSLSTPAKSGPGLCVAVARMYEQSGRWDEAEVQYQRALKERPDDLAALLGYARLKERMDQPEEALKFYQRVTKMHSKEAAGFNNLGLFYARRGMFQESVGSLNRAIQLQPRRHLYRNNIATVLVEIGRLEEAFTHLSAVHGEAIAYYNLGYLLNKKGDIDGARRHFNLALEASPKMAEARQWLERLSVMAPNGSSGGPQPDAVRVGARPRPTAVQANPPQGDYPGFRVNENGRVGSDPRTNVPAPRFGTAPPQGPVGELPSPRLSPMRGDALPHQGPPSQVQRFPVAHPYPATEPPRQGPIVLAPEPADARPRTPLPTGPAVNASPLFDAPPPQARPGTVTPMPQPIEQPQRLPPAGAPIPEPGAPMAAPRGGGDRLVTPLPPPERRFTPGY